MIRDFKAQIFCRENNLSKREIDTGDQVWIDRIDAFFRKTALLPPDGSPTEYAEAFEAVYPEPRHRRQFIDDAISKGTPCFGHRVLGSMIAARLVDCVFTTNFDPLIEEAALGANALLPVSNQARPTVAAIDSAERAMRCLSESDWPLIAKLHGDYQSIAIKNTETELERQDERMRHVLVESAQRFGMVFIGYSGRDASVMQALASVLREKSPFPNGLYWVTSSTATLLPAVLTFLQSARDLGVDVAIVESKTFDELAGDVLKHVKLPQSLLDQLELGRSAPRVVPVKLPAIEVRQTPVLRYSALLVESLPSVARRVTVAQATTSAAVRVLLKEQRCRAVIAANGRELAVFGRDDQVIAALSPLGGQIAGTIGLDATKDSWALGLLYDALVRALSRHRPLIPRFKRSGHSLIVTSPQEGEEPEKTLRRDQDLSRLRSAYDSALTGRVPKLEFPYNEGVFLKLEQIEDRWWCGFEPYTFVDIPRREMPAESQSADRDLLGMPQERKGGDPAGDWRRERWAPKYNKNWASIIDAWATLLSSTKDGSVRAFGLEEGAGMDAVFNLSKLTAWSRPGHHHSYFDRTR